MIFIKVQGYRGTRVQGYRGAGVRRCGGTEGGMGECGIGCTPQAPLPGGGGGGLRGLLRLPQPADDLPPNPPPALRDFMPGG